MGRRDSHPGGKSQDKVEAPAGGRRFTEEQEAYLLNPATLSRWVVRSLEERLQLFKRRYPESNASLYMLRKLYKEHKIRKKMVRITKLPTKLQQEDIIMQAAELRQSVQFAYEQGRRIVMLDEFMVTKRTLLTHAWSPLRFNEKVDMK